MNNPKRILVISQYFHPENFRINDLVFSLKKRGHQVEVLTGKPNYPKGDYFDGYSWIYPKKEIIKGIKVHRANLILRKKGGGFRLFLNYSSFVFFGFFKLLKIKSTFDKVIIYAPSPITVGILGILASKLYRVKSYLWVHDLWPESVKVAGGIKNKFLLGLIDLMTRIIYHFTDIILIQSPFFTKYLKEQKVDLNKVIYYPYYAEDFYKPVSKDPKILQKFPNGFNLIFAGNLGIAQNFDTLVHAIELIKNLKINVIVLGNGRDKKRILNLINKKNLEDKFYFLGVFKPEEMASFFACSDALIITLKKSEIFSYTIPGKLQSYLACGKPIVGALDGIGKKIILESGAGYCDEAENIVALKNNIVKLFNLSEKNRKAFGIRGINYFNKNFNKNNLLEKLEYILEDL